MYKEKKICFKDFKLWYQWSKEQKKKQNFGRKKDIGKSRYYYYYYQKFKETKKNFTLNKRK